MKIPYGIANFADVRSGGYFYVDKTPFLPVLEDLGPRSLLFLRPRRMGKSLLVSLLSHYYDLDRAEQFDALFRGLWIHEHPTPERGRYLVLALDFSQVGVDGDDDALRRSFLEAVRGPVEALLLRYRDRIPPLADLHQALDQIDDAAALIGRLSNVVSATGHKLYLLIDEYDNFANRLLSAGAEDVYTKLVERTGFVRTFYGTLKIGTQSGAIGRIFITGVAPLLLDDMSSGFNIVTHIF
jgi:Predicted AAA-ATPase